MASNKFEIEINASIDKVWLALTNTDEFGKWMKSIKIQTDWKQGSEITYTCYDENGTVVKWDGMDMIWQGSIKTIEENKEFTCIYPSKSTGLELESFILEKLEDNKTKLTQIQLLISEAIADGYKEGTAHTLNFLKNHLEKN